jgi:hypothetical protein
MTNHWQDKVIKTEQMTILLPGQTEPTLINLKCFPSSSQNRKSFVMVEMEFEERDRIKNWFKFGQLDKDGFMVSWKNKHRFAGYELHDELKANKEKLLPDGRLIICIQITVNFDRPELISTTASKAKPLQMKHQHNDHQPTENIYKDMLDQFVDVGGNVLLVFEDGEQQCHTFPLASRYPLNQFYLKNSFWIKYAL